MHNPTTFTIFAPMTNNHKIVDYDAVLDAKFGKEGTPERARAEEAAYSFYSGQILQDARKEAKMTQSELAVAAALSRHRAALAAPCHFLFPLHHPADAFQNSQKHLFRSTKISQKHLFRSTKIAFLQKFTETSFRVSPPASDFRSCRGLFRGTFSNFAAKPLSIQIDWQNEISVYN